MWDWKPNLDPLQVKQVLAVTEPSLQPFCCAFLTTTAERIPSRVYSDFHSFTHQLSSECTYVPDTVLGIQMEEGVKARPWFLRRLPCIEDADQTRVRKTCTAQGAKITP